MTTFNLYYDPGHAWLEVPKTLIKELGITNKISSFSYENGENVYLEEDCDLATFAKVYKGKFSVKEIGCPVGDSFVRYYKHFEGGAA